MKDFLHTKLNKLETALAVLFEQIEPKQSRAAIVKGKALKMLWDKWNETGKSEDVVNVAKELFGKCQNDEDRNAVMLAQEEFEMQIDAMMTPCEHEDAGDRV